MGAFTRIDEIVKSEGFIIIYKRLSKEGIKGVALDQQEKTCFDWLYRNGFDIEKEQEKGNIKIISDEITGRTNNRNGYQQMVELLPKTRLIVTSDVTRISRKALYTMLFEEERKKTNAEIIYINQSIASWNKATYNVLLHIFSALAENEVDIISERQLSSKNQTKHDGRGAWTGGVPPYAFVSKKIQEERGNGKTRIVPYLFNVKEQGDIVKLLYKKYKELRSIDKVCVWCDDNNFKDNNNKNFSRSKITDIIRNIDYVVPSKEAYSFFKDNGATINNDISEWKSTNGIICYNRYTQRDKIKGTKHQINPIKEWIISISKKHTGSVPFKLWRECRDIMEAQTTNSGKPHLSNGISVLNGIIRCRCCGEKMYPKNKYKRSENDDMFFENGDPRFSYRCKNGNNAKTKKLCNNRSLIRGNEIDKIVVETIINMFTVDNNELAKTLKEAKKGLFVGTSNTLVETNLKMLKNSLKTCKKKQEKYRKLLESIDDKISPLVVQDYAKKLEDSLNEYEKIQRDIEKANQELRDNYDVSIEAEKIMSIIHNMKNGFDKMTINEKKDCVQLLVKEVRLDKEQLDIIFVDDSTKNIMLPNSMYTKRNINALQK